LDFVNPNALFGLLVLPVLFILTFWRGKRVPTIIPSVYLWEKIKDKNPPIKSLRKPRITLLSILQALAIIFSVVAISNPRIPSKVPKSINAVIVVDTSASMQTITGTQLARGGGCLNNKIRFDVAKGEIRKILDKLSKRDKIIFITSTYLGHDSKEMTKNDAYKYLEDLVPLDCEADTKRLLSIAPFFTDPNKENFLFVVSDKDVAVPEWVSLLEAPTGEKKCNFRGVAKILVGSSQTDNIGITNFSIDRREDNLYDVFVAIMNCSKEKKLSVTLTTSDRGPLEKRECLIKEGMNYLIFDSLNLQSEKRICVTINNKDNFPLDDTVVASKLVKLTPLSVSLFGKDNCLLRKAFDSCENCNVNFYHSLPETVKDDICIFNSVMPQKIPDGNIVILNPPPFTKFYFCNSSFFCGEEIANGEIKQVGVPTDFSNKFLNSVEPSEIKISQAKEITCDNPTKKNLLAIGDKIVAVFLEDGTNSILVLSFGLDGSKDSWMCYPSFPIFWANYIDYIRNSQVRANDFEILKREEYKIEHPTLPARLDTRLGTRIANLLSEEETKNSGNLQLLDEKFLSTLLEKNDTQPLRLGAQKKELSIYFVIASFILVLASWLARRKEI